MKYYGFVYEWTDSSNGLKYIGSHKGLIDDGYVSSNNIINKIYKKRPLDLTRKILEYIYTDEYRDLLKLEQFYLDKIQKHELYSVENRKNKTIKYYNMKKHAAGGNGGIGSNGSLTGKNKYYHKDTLEQKFFSPTDNISNDWIKGVPKSKTSSDGKDWYYNISTGKSKRSSEKLDGDWIKGRPMIKTTSKKVHTPYGIYESAAECARRNNLKVGTVCFRCRQTTHTMKDWYYIKD